jgi:hypothetical protein
VNVPHRVTLVLPSFGSGRGTAWVARCACGETSATAPTHDGRLATAIAWKRGHELVPEPPVQTPTPPLPIRRPRRVGLDEPDPTLDRFDAFLRGLNRK